mmetsp:Transcript_2760/g.3984  ORF Transcript_2760/g.3984 Transcript_2760/m.3984 type:complete len:180 (-) Transcript_2760:129-668(-)
MISTVFVVAVCGVLPKLAVASGSGNGTGSGSTASCAYDQYISRPATPTSNVMCSPLSTCEFNQGMFQSKAPVPGISDRECSKITPCTSSEVVRAPATAYSNYICSPKSNPTLDTTQVTVLSISGVILGILAIVAVLGSIKNKKRKSAGDDEDHMLEMGESDDHLLDTALSGSNPTNIYE